VSVIRIDTEPGDIVATSPAESIFRSPRAFGRRKTIVRSWLTTPSIIALGLLTVVALAAPLLAPHDPLKPVGAPFSAPGTDGALLGTDQVGRDILSRILYGLQSSWFASIVVVFAGAAIGCAIGVVAGLRGGRVDAVLMRVTELFLALPWITVVIAIVAALGPSLKHTVIAITAVAWPYYARIIRTEIRALAARPHMEAARLSGESSLRLGLRHLLPGALPTVIINMSLDLGGLVVVLGSLSFLGLGAQPPSPELGAMSAQGMNYVLSAWWVPVMPGIAIFVLAMIANLSGDGIRELMEDR
jgi:peptide/nickel transport system permease protein